MSIVSVEALGLQIGQKTILTDVHLAIMPGSFQLIIGPNGAGKSSFLKCLLGLHPYAGSIKIEGSESSGMGARQRARLMAYVPQFLDVQFHLEVRSLMRLSRFAYDETPKASMAAIEKAMSQTETLHLQDAFLDELSGGERQRVMIAAALAQEPKLLVLDEPSTAMDPGHKRDLVHLLERLHRDEQLTILVVTHDWNEFGHLNPQVMALKDGRTAFHCQADGLKAHLEPLFNCKFHHIRVGDHEVNWPDYLDREG